MIKVNINVEAANRIANELPALRLAAPFTNEDGYEFIIEGLMFGLRRMQGISPVEATCRQLWVSKVGVDVAFRWFASHYGLYKVPIKFEKPIDNLEETC